MADSYLPADLPARDEYMGELRQTLGDLDRILGEDSAPPPVSARAALEAQARQAGPGARNGSRPASAPPRAMPAPVAKAPPAPTPAALAPRVPSAPASESQPAPPPADSRDLQLLMRFAAGALILGAENLAARARRWEERAPAEGEAAAGDARLDEAGYLELARYWTLGALAYGRRAGVSALRGALSGPEGMVPALIDMTDRATSLIFLRPLRRPLESALRRAQATSRDWIVEGWREEQLSRWVAQNSVPEILDDVIAIISKNPELAELVREQISKQGVSAAATLIESSRSLTAVGDDAVETFVRRLFRRGLRAEGPRIEPKAGLPPRLAFKTEPGDDHSA